MDIAISQRNFNLTQIAKLDLSALLVMLKSSTSNNRDEFASYVGALLAEERYNDVISFVAQSLSPKNAIKWAIHSLRAIDPAIVLHPAWRGIDAWSKTEKFHAITIDEPIEAEHPACWLHAALFWMHQDHTPKGLVAEAVCAAIKLQLRLTQSDLRSRGYRFFAENAQRYVE